MLACKKRCRLDSRIGRKRIGRSAVPKHGVEAGLNGGLHLRGLNT